MTLLAALVDLQGAPIGPAELEPMLAGPGAPGAGTACWSGGNAALGSLDPAVERPWGAPAGPALVGDLLLTERRALARRLELPETSDDRLLVLAAYRRWGIEAPSHLTGDFAFILWDPTLRRLLAARDPLGIKSLCWTLRGSQVAIATEPSQLVPRGFGAEIVDRVAVADHLVGNLEDEERTFFRDVRYLRAGHTLIVESGAPPSIRRHWDIPEELPLSDLDETQAAEEVLALLQTAVADRLAPEGPTGVLLSGGLDSSTVAVLAAERAQTPPVATHYSCARWARCDERAYAAACRDAMGFELVEIAAERFPLLSGTRPEAPALDTPFVGWETFLRQSLETFRRRGVGVAMSGHGGDCLFQGTSRTYLDGLLQGRIGVLGELVREARESGYGVMRLVYRYLLAPLAPSGADALVGWLVGRPRRDPMPPWVAPELRGSTDLANRMKSWRSFRGERRFQREARQNLYAYAVHLGSVGRAVRWQSRVSRPLGIDLRHPLLDQRLVQAVLQVPPEMHFGAGRTKRLLRTAMVGRLPESVRTRRDKPQFRDLVRAGLANGASWIEHVLRDPISAELGFVDGSILRSRYTGSREHGFDGLEVPFWHALTLELWLRRHFDRRECPMAATTESGLGWR